MKGMQAYPREAGGDNASLYGWGDYSHDCMQAKGYVSIDKQGCRSAWLSETEEDCYRRPWPWE